MTNAFGLRVFTVKYVYSESTIKTNADMQAEDRARKNMTTQPIFKSILFRNYSLALFLSVSFSVFRLHVCNWHNYIFKKGFIRDFSGSQLYIRRLMYLCRNQRITKSDKNYQQK